MLTATLNGVGSRNGSNFPISFVFSFMIVSNPFIHLSICETKKFSILFCSPVHTSATANSFLVRSLACSPALWALCFSRSMQKKRMMRKKKLIAFWVAFVHGRHCGRRHRRLRQIKRISFVFIIFCKINNMVCVLHSVHERRRKWNRTMGTKCRNGGNGASVSAAVALISIYEWNRINFYLIEIYVCTFQWRST